QFERDTQQATYHVEKLRVSGMRCAACAQLIEFRVRQVQGVDTFKINLASHTAELSWLPQEISLKKILNAIGELGYAAFPASQSMDDYEQRTQKKALWRIFVAGFAMMQVMMYAFPAYLVPVADVNGDLTPEIDHLLKLASLIITIPVIGFSAMGFFESAWRDLKNRHIGMDVPVSLGIALSFLASIWATFVGGAVYFDSVIMFVFLLLLARHIEGRIQHKTTIALRTLTQLRPVLAQRFTDFALHRLTEQVDASHLQINDIVLVAAGETIPADGIVLEGQSACDESMMTGESKAVSKQIGDALMAGTINLQGALVMRAERVGQATQLSALIGMMENAAMEKPPLVHLADRHASHFLIAILCIAGLAGVYWWYADPARALWIAISVIVVTCPCALSLATPGVMSAAIGSLAKRGVLVVKGRAIESMAKATHFVFDKTGTLTLGRLNLTAWTDFSAEGAEGTVNMPPDDIARLALALAAQSRHPAAIAITESLTQQIKHNKADSIGLQLNDATEIPGGGISAYLHGIEYRLGSVDFVSELYAQKDVQHILIPTEFSDKSVTALGNKQGCIALFALEDSLRADAATTVKTLLSMNKKVLLLSGDRHQVVARMAAAAGITNFYADLSPADKYQKIKALQEQGAKVVMIGDGMNDGPALSLADVSVVMGQGAPISQSRSDLLLMSNRLSDLVLSVQTSNKAMHLIRQNLGWAGLYNLIAIPAAVAGLLEPWHAALGMTLSSLLVVANALRLLSPPAHASDIPVSMLPATPKSTLLLSGIQPDQSTMQ
ncbi:MAG: cation-translocating P-type ATPase, partial [Burkholderiaceae bacterium]|nr:cation-translocating P-type ATPase [Burkholderiaceae bacterium]